VPFTNITEEIDLFDRKVERVLKLDGADFVRDMRHLLVESWLKNPRINPYVREMLVTRQRAMDDFLQAIRPLRGAMKSLMEALLEEYPILREDGDAGRRLVERWGDTYAERFSLSKFGRLAETEGVSSGDSIPGWEPTNPYRSERTVEGWMIEILSQRVEELWTRDKRWARDGKGRRMHDAFNGIVDSLNMEVHRYVDWKLVAPEAAMHDLLVVVGGLNPEPQLEGLELDPEEIITRGLELAFVEKVRDLVYEPKALMTGDEERTAEEILKYKASLSRAYEGLLERLGSSLTATTLVDRYKIRSEVYRKSETRRLAESAIAAGKGLEDSLARDLCAYLYDQGVFALYRARFEDLEPDILSMELALGSSPLLVETKAHAKAMRKEIVEGVAQCVSYLSTLSSTVTGGVYEAHYVIFRVDGPLYQLPTELRYGEYRIFPKVVDLAASAGRGRRQAGRGVAPVTEKEILDKIGEKLGSQTPPE
jgi:hypothetical protein